MEAFINIAELFVRVGLTDENVVLKGLKKVGEGFKAAASEAWQMKAAVVGALYGLERLTKNASQEGLELRKFADTFGLSTEKLQEFQIRLREWDAEEDLQPAIIGLKKAITAAQFGQADSDMLAGMNMFGIDPFKVESEFEIIERIGNKIKSTSGAERSKALFGASKLGISDNLFQGLANTDFKKAIDKSLILTPKQIATLSDINKEWKQFWWNMQRFGTSAVAAYGGAFIGSLSNTVKILRDASGWVGDMLREFEAMKYVIIAIGVALAFYFAPITAAIASIIYLLSEFQKYREGKANIYSSIKGAADEATGLDRVQSGEKRTGWEKIMSGLSGFIPGMGAIQAVSKVSEDYNKVKAEKENDRIWGKQGDTTSSTTNIMIDGINIPPESDHAKQLVKTLNTTLMTSSYGAGF